MSRDIFQGPEVITGLVLGRDEQEKNVDQLAVQCGKIDSSPRQGHCSNQAMERRVTRMGNRHALPDTRGAELFTPQDCAGSRSPGRHWLTCRHSEPPDHLTDRFFLATGLQVDDDRVACCRRNPITSSAPPTTARRSDCPADRNPVYVASARCIRQRHCDHTGTNRKRPPTQGGGFAEIDIEGQDWEAGRRRNRFASLSATWAARTTWEMDRHG